MRNPNRKASVKPRPVHVAACGSGSVGSAPAPGFYLMPSSPTSSPGTLLRYQAIGTDIAGAHTYRILYVSAASDGDPRTAGGVVVLPDA
jgi:hypothetical protein